jgi:hypothetical protein
LVGALSSSAFAQPAANTKLNTPAAKYFIFTENPLDVVISKKTLATRTGQVKHHHRLRLHDTAISPNQNCQLLQHFIKNYRIIAIDKLNTPTIKLIIQHE